VIDYVAGSGEPRQSERLSRDRIYRYNQIPATVLGPPDLDKSNWDKDLYARLEQLYRRAFDPMRYTLADILSGYHDRGDDPASRPQQAQHQQQAPKPEAPPLHVPIDSRTLLLNHAKLLCLLLLLL
jgi:hypothetical protein